MMNKNNVLISEDFIREFGGKIIYILVLGCKNIENRSILYF